MISTCGGSSHGLRGAQDRVRPASRRSRDRGSRAGSRACRASGSPPRCARSSPAAARARRGRRALDPRALHLRRQIGQVRENSCSGGSSRRIVTGRPVIASKRPSKSSCCSGSRSRERRLRAPRRRRPGSSPRIFGWRSSAMNMCSVRHRPMPSAPSSRALRGVLRRVGVRPHAEPAQSSAHPRTVSSSRISSKAGPRASTSGTSSSVTSPLVPLMAMKSPGLDRRRRRRGCSAPRGRSSARTAPVTHGTPMPRATSAACLALPPRLVRMPLAAWKPATSLASVNGPDEDRRRAPRLGGLDGLGGGEDDLALGAAGRGGDARGDDLVVGAGSKVRTAAPRACRRRWSSAPARGSAAPRRPRRTRTAPRPARGAWRCASGACRAARPPP